MVLEEPTTYQAIARKERLAEAQHILCRLGQKRFGPIDDATAASLNAIGDVQKLEELSERVYDVANWQELVQPAKRRRSTERRQRNA